ncbi:MAG: hypothetical protein Q7R75_00110 [bacterium]|nr:hypothetical protein [bacterium]
MKNWLGNKKIKFVAMTVLLILVILALSLLLFYLFNRANQKIMEINDIRGQFYKYQRGAEKIRVLEKDMAELETWKQEASGLILNKDTIVKFVEDAEQLANIAGVSLEMKSVNIFDGAEEKPRFTLGVEGNFSSLYQFMRLLENSRYKIEFISASIKKPENEKTGNWFSEISLRLLSFQNEEI